MAPLPKTKKRKRTGNQSAKPNKKPKIDNSGGGYTKTLKGKDHVNAKHVAPTKKKEKAFTRATISVPVAPDSSASDVSDEDVQFVEELQKAGSGAFLKELDAKAIARSKKETERLFEITKLSYQRVQPKDSLPAIDSDSNEDDDKEWSSGMEGFDLREGDQETDESEFMSEDEDEESELPGRDSMADSEEEQPYEKMPRPNQDKPKAANSELKRKTISRLPIKLPNGQIQQTGIREGSFEMSSEDEEKEAPTRLQQLPKPPKSNIAGSRFGRAALGDIIRIKSRKERLDVAKEQIAGICQDILAEPENGLGLLRRLLAFAASTVTIEDDAYDPNGADSTQRSKKVENDPVIRQLAIISLTAIFVDITPGYRIRKLTDKEKDEKVSQMVGQTRDWEQGLVGVYQTYLGILDAEIRGKTTLDECALQCMCTLLGKLTHFNFRTNIMSTLIARLSRKSWDDRSEDCVNALISVFKHDLTGLPSLEVVRLLNRMIKERNYAVNPKVLSCLMHLRLKTELIGVRASKERADKSGDGAGKRHSESKAKLKRAKGKAKPGNSLHLSKKAKKALKETKEIRAEMEEAEAEVDREERTVQHTETLKLLFVLYFSILKAPKTTPLLIPALLGISRFAHLVNIDFFRDLLAALREIMQRNEASEDDDEEPRREATDHQSREQRIRLLCIVTAFELLTGQGEALDLDLSDFSTYLYKILPQLATILTLEEEFVPQGIQNNQVTKKSETTADILFRALNLILIPKWGKTGPEVALRILEFVQTLLGREPKLDGLLSTEDRVANGVYRAEVDDPQLCNPFAAAWWEVLVLEERHFDERVRKRAKALHNWKPS